jgi:hypothetical protein
MRPFVRINNLTGDAEAIFRVCGKCREHDEQGSTCGHESVGAQTGHALPLAFRADECTEDWRESQTNLKVMPQHVSFPSALHRKFRS